MSKLILKKIKKHCFGRSLKPVSKLFGFDRGTPIDRYYIEIFLQENSKLVTGDVLEIAETTYTKKFGVDVTKAKLLHCSDNNADIVGDLATGEGIPENAIDCFIMTQTLPFIYDIKSAVKNAYKLLKPGGTLLVTVGGISQISRYDMERWGHYWSFTDLSLRKVLEEAFLSENIEITTYGNVKVASAFLYGLAAHELSRKTLEYTDKDYQVLICAVAKKE